MELNRVGFALYADFRPEVTGWGKRGELRCEVLTCTPEEKKCGPGGFQDRCRNWSDQVANQSVVKYETSDGCGVAQLHHTVIRMAILGSTTRLMILSIEFTIEELSTLP
jgi:hypothetical protein